MNHLRDKPASDFFSSLLKSLTSGSGKLQPPAVGTEDGVHCLGKLVVNGSATGAVQFDVLGGMKGCIITHVIIKRPNVALPAGMAGRVYSAPAETFLIVPPATVAPDPVWHDEALIAPEFSLAGLSGYAVKRIAGIAKLTEPTMFYYRPMGTAGPAGSTFELEVWGYTEWYSNLPKPLART